MTRGRTSSNSFSKSQVDPHSSEFYVHPTWDESNVFVCFLRKSITQSSLSSVLVILPPRLTMDGWGYMGWDRGGAAVDVNIRCPPLDPQLQRQRLRGSN